MKIVNEEGIKYLLLKIKDHLSNNPGSSLTDDEIDSMLDKLHTQVDLINGEEI